MWLTGVGPGSRGLCGAKGWGEPESWARAGSAARGCPRPVPAHFQEQGRAAGQRGHPGCGADPPPAGFRPVGAGARLPCQRCCAKSLPGCGGARPGVTGGSGPLVLPRRKRGSHPCSASRHQHLGRLWSQGAVAPNGCSPAERESRWFHRCLSSRPEQLRPGGGGGGAAPSSGSQAALTRRDGGMGGVGTKAASATLGAQARHSVSAAAHCPRPRRPRGQAPTCPSSGHILRRAFCQCSRHCPLLRHQRPQWNPRARNAQRSTRRPQAHAGPI